MIVGHGGGDEQAGAAARHQIALGDQALIGFDGGDASNVVLGREQARGRQARPRLELAGEHRLAEERHDLVLQGCRAGAVERQDAPERLDGLRHGGGPRQLDLSEF
jgi:hypothetical protein